MPSSFGIVFLIGSGSGSLESELAIGRAEENGIESVSG